MWTLSSFLTSPKSVQNLSRRKNGMTFNFCGQALDNLWICLSNLCPSVWELDRGSTVLGHYLDCALTDSLHDRFLDSPWTVIGQLLNKHWILCPISVQPSIVNLYPKFKCSQSTIMPLCAKCKKMSHSFHKVFWNLVQLRIGKLPR